MNRQLEINYGPTHYINSEGKHKIRFEMEEQKNLKIDWSQDMETIKKQITEKFEVGDSVYAFPIVGGGKEYGTITEIKNGRIEIKLSEPTDMGQTHASYEVDRVHKSMPF